MRLSLAIALAVPSFAAELILTNGRIVTMDSRRPVAEAVAIEGNRFVRVGTAREVLAAAGPDATRIDLKGRTVLPGLYDSHTHPVSAALSEIDGPVPVMHTIAEVQAYIRKLAATTPADRVIFVPKVYATRLKERRYPNRHELDQAAPGRLAMTDNGYASVLNSALLAKAGITRATPEPANGKIIRDASGEPTGLILGATQLLGPLRATRSATRQERLDGLRKMQRAYNRAGITSTIDRGQSVDGFRLYEELKARGEMTVRTYVTITMTPRATLDEVRAQIQAIPLRTGQGDDWLRVGSIKTVADGGILIGTAFLREPYGERTQPYGYVDPDYRGVLAVPRENLVAMARAANELGWQMTAHVAGGGAIDALLDAYEAADKDKSIAGRRFTVTHGNFPNGEAIARARRLGVAFDVQPAWHHHDGPVLEGVFGPNRIRDFIPLRAMIDAGVVVAGGSDHMIRFDAREAINPYHPFFGMWMAVTRRMADGRVLGPEQRIKREEALRMWTLNAAYLSFEEKTKGSIEAGKVADLLVVDRDFLNCPEEEIRSIEPLVTMVDGRVVHGEWRMLK
jgi:predicted amidohydrolase YtcJ